jgi:hypothetical protein
METALIQSAGAPAPTPSASASFDGVPAPGDSFTLALGRALGTAPSLTQGAPSSDPIVSRREKSAAADDSSTAAGLLLSCVFASFVQPPPTLAPNTEATEPAAGHEDSGPAALSTSGAILEASTDTASKQAETASTREATAGVAALNALSGMVPETLGTVGTTNSEAPTPVADDNGKIPTNGPDRAGSTPLPELANAAPAYVPEIQELPGPTKTVGQQVVEMSSLPPTEDLQSPSNPALPSSRSKELQALHAQKTAEPAPSQGSQTLSSPALPSVRSKEAKSARRESHSYRPLRDGRL